MPGEVQPALPFLTFSEEVVPQPGADELFRRKFGDPLPAYPHHFTATYRDGNGDLHLASYGHVMLHLGMGLGGGSCTDQRVLRLMSADERAAVKSAGGLHFLLIRFIFERFVTHAPVLFAYCGDARAEMVDLRAGFEKTEYSYLLRRVLRPLTDAEVADYTRRAAAIGPF